MRRLVLAATAALACALAAPAAANARYDAGDIFYGGPAAGMDNGAVTMYSALALKHYGKWVDGSRLDIYRPDFKRAYVRAHTPLPQCLYLRRDPWSGATNNNTSTFVGIWAPIPGRLCRSGPPS